MINSDSEIKYQWQKGGTIIESKPDRWYRSNENDPDLVLNNLHESDSGIYTMKVTNRFGSNSVDIDVKVGGKC